jgi:hypothetical protein
LIAEPSPKFPSRFLSSRSFTATRRSSRPGTALAASRGNFGSLGERL